MNKNKASNVLAGAARQYRRNNKDVFIVAYDKEKTEKVVNDLLTEISRLKKDNLINEFYRTLDEVENDPYNKDVFILVYDKTY